jgi:GTP cyclohydrolase II
MLATAKIRTRLTLPLRFGAAFVASAEVVTFHGLVDGRDHLALGFGDPTIETPLVRLHSECLTGDVFGSERCDCGPQLLEAVERISATGGYVLYLRQEGRGIGLYDKLDAYALQDAGLDTYQANVALGHSEDERDYAVAAQMLAALDVDAANILTNNYDKIVQLEKYGFEVLDQVPTGVHQTSANAAYLRSKAERQAANIRS